MHNSFENMPNVFSRVCTLRIEEYVEDSKVGTKVSYTYKNVKPRQQCLIDNNISCDCLCKAQTYTKDVNVSNRYKGLSKSLQAISSVSYLILCRVFASQIALNLLNALLFLLF